jgi:hypothetical protein
VNLIKQHLGGQRGSLTPAGQRLALQLLDTTWRGARNDPRRREAVAAERDWLANRFGELPAVLLYRGAEAMLSNQRSDAFTFYIQAANEAGESGLSRMYVGAYSVRSTDVRDWTEGGPKKPIGCQKQISWLCEPLEKGKICVLVAADDAYFQKFGRLLYDNFRSLDRSSQIHFHVINWSDDCLKVLPANDRRLSISHEKYRYVRDYTYFAAVRFFRALEIMSHLNVPLYITDIDNKFRASASEILEELRSHDAGFRFQENGLWFPWWGPSAGNTWLNYNAEGMIAAEWLRDYVGSRFVVNKPARTWWFDQLALNEIQNHARNCGYRIADLGQPHLAVSVARPRSEITDLKSKRRA